VACDRDTTTHAHSLEPEDVKMSRLMGCTLLATALAVVAPAEAQRDDWAGTWRGALTTEGASTDVTLTIVVLSGAYSGVITGFAAGTEVRLSDIRVGDAELTLKGATETDFGPLAFVYDLTREDAALVGGGRVMLGSQRFDVSLELTRARRTDVVQPQVEQRIGYFAGEWIFEYTGREFPPLSIGTRTGTVSFRAVDHGPFVRGKVSGEFFGEAYEEAWTIGFDEDTQTVLWREELSTGDQLISLGNWTSPIGITFLTTPVEADGRVYVLKRRMRVTSDTAFSVTDEFSVDGGPFGRLGTASYIRTN
jgi:hypothetical protein